MCMMCDGASYDDVLFNLHGKIDRFGWMVQGVEGSGTSPPWAYTIGLVDTFGHPELFLGGVELNGAATLINEAVHLIGGGRRLHHGDTLLLLRSATLARVTAVHPAHLYTSAFAVWHNYYQALHADPDGPPPPQLTAVELTLPFNRSSPPQPDFPPYLAHEASLFRYEGPPLPPARQPHHPWRSR